MNSLPREHSVNGFDSRTEIHLGRESGFFILRTQLFLPRSRTEVFPFFADIRNLEKITPSWLQFKILTPLPVAMRVGTLIEYRIRLHGFPLRWQTEITTWDPPYLFVDEQRRGPYRTWIHEHSFVEHRDGCIMRDFVRYRVAGGRLVNFIFVRKDVTRIFTYRTKVLQKIFENGLFDKVRG